MAPSTTGKYNLRGELNGLWAARPLNSAGPLYSFGQRVATRVGGTLYYVHSDHLGSTVAVSDADGQAIGRVQYDPYGEVITSTLPVTLTDRLFTGQRLDNSTGLYYYTARYYDPHLGRFIQPDTLVPDPLNPQAWNRFSYCYNNPTSYVDPSGHDGILVPLLIFGGAFLIGAGAGGYYAYQQGYGFESWQLYAYAGMGGLAGVAGAATGMWIEAALLPVGAAAGQAFLAGAAGGFAAGVVEQSILEAGGAYILGTEVSGERILLAGVTGGVTGGLLAGASRWWRLRASEEATRASRSYFRRVSEQMLGRGSRPTRTTTINGRQFVERMELHHRFIPQRWRWVPDWLKHAKWNLEPVWTLEHAARDPYRYQFLPSWVKQALGK